MSGSPFWTRDAKARRAAVLPRIAVTRALALQATLDGFLLRYRIMPEDYPSSRWEGAGIFADTVLAVILGVIDTDRSGTSSRKALDKIVGRRAWRLATP
jgi:hypothetical protein